MFTEPVQNRSEKRESTRLGVLAAAERLFREQGFGATTVRQIAADAEVSTGTVMAVGDKAALLVAIFDGWIGAVHDGRSATRRAVRGSGSVLDAMDVFEPFINYFARDRELSGEYAAIIARGSHESAIFQNLAESLVAEIEEVLLRTGLTRAEAEQGSRVIYFAYLGIIMTMNNGAVDMQTSIDRLRDVVGFVISHTGGKK
jgi:AcrR family transcriptional regulator